MLRLLLSGLVSRRVAIPANVTGATWGCARVNLPGNGASGTAASNVTWQSPSTQGAFTLSNIHLGWGWGLRCQSTGGHFTTLSVTLTATATAADPSIDWNPANNTATAIHHPDQADLATSISASNPSNVAGRVGYTVRVQNLGPGSAGGATLDIVEPANLQGAVWQCTSNLPSVAFGTVTRSGATVTIHNILLAPNATLSCNAGLQAHFTGSSVTLTATAAVASGVDWDLTNNTTTVVFPPQ